MQIERIVSVPVSAQNRVLRRFNKSVDQPLILRMRGKNSFRGDMVKPLG